MLKEFDIVVIGSGPGGYVSAIRASQLGFNVACIENRKNSQGKFFLGGTCLNVGCIPTKALLASSEFFEKIQKHSAVHGITIGNINIDITKMHARKDDLVTKMTLGIEYLFNKNKITLYKGHGHFINKQDNRYQIEILGDNYSVISAQYVIIATGSKPRLLNNIQIDNKIICDNEGALTFSTVPSKLAIIGGGVIGLELGSVWHRLGSHVTILESMPIFLGNTDISIAKEAKKQFSEQGLNINLGIQNIKVNKVDNKVSIFYEDKNNISCTLDVDRLIISVGRIPNTDNLGLNNIGLCVNELGFINVDECCKTNLKNIYAIGDVVRGPMLAHKAEEEGILVAEIIAGQKPCIDYNCIPWVIYTTPEIAWVGKTEQQLKIENKNIKIGKFPFSSNGRACGINSPQGFVKIIADAKTDEILGIHIISVNASDLITEGVIAMEFKAASEDIARISHPHPSLSEVIREAALAVDNRAINI